MKNTLFLAFVLSTIFLYGQNSNSTQSFAKHRVQVGVNVAPTMGYRVLTNDGNMGYIINNRNENEVPNIGFSVGADVVLNFSQLLSAQMGIHYASMRYQTKFYSAFIPVTTVPDPSIPKKAKFQYNYQYMDVPMTLNFTVGKKKVRFLGRVGLVVNLFIKDMETTVSQYPNKNKESKAESNEAFNRVNLSSIFSAGIDYGINDRIHLRVMPTFQIQAFPIIHGPIQERLFTAGVNFGCYFGF